MTGSQFKYNQINILKDFIKSGLACTLELLYGCLNKHTAKTATMQLCESG